MIKKILVNIFVLSIALSLNAAPVFAAVTPTSAKKSPTPASTTPSVSTTSAQKAIGEKLNQQINQLKERIASRVAELNLVEKRGVIGTVTESSGNQVTFTDLAGKTRIIDVDEITKFSSPSSKSGFGLSDLVKGTKISVLGLYNKQSQRILARFIDAYVVPVYLSGRIAKIDKVNFQIAVMSEVQKETLVDIETITKINTYTSEDGISKLGFSKLIIGDRVLVTGFPGKNDPKILSATRILDLAELPKNSKIIITEPTIIEDLSPTTGSSPAPSKKVTPTKATEE